jgi:hypothetical protein
MRVARELPFSTPGVPRLCDGIRPDRFRFGLKPTELEVFKEEVLGIKPPENKGLEALGVNQSGKSCEALLTAAEITIESHVWDERTAHRRARQPRMIFDNLVAIVCVNTPFQFKTGMIGCRLSTNKRQTRMNLFWFVFRRGNFPRW